MSDETTITDSELAEAEEFLIGAGWRIVTTAKTLARRDLKELLARFRGDTKPAPIQGDSHEN